MMTPLFIVAAIAAAPLVIWFWWRKEKSRAVKETAETRPAASPLIEEHVNAEQPEVEPHPDRPPLVKTEEVFGAPEEEHPAAFEPATVAQSQAETDSSILHNAGSHHGDGGGITLWPDEQTGPSEESSQEHSGDIPVLRATEIPPEHE